MQGVVQNNNATLSGVVMSDFQYNYTVINEKFYKSFIKIERHSGAVDVIPINVSENIADLDNIKIGDFVTIKGQFRSYNQQTEENKSRLLLTVHVRSIEKEDTETYCINDIYLNGYICKKPIYRITPQGRRITDVFLAVNRAYGRCDYIPCIFWGNDAYTARYLQVGSQCIVQGRIQSREYEKDNGKYIEKKTAYEVSIKSIISMQEDKGE